MFLSSDIDEVPRVQMRSVGIIEVTVPESSGIKAAAAAAASKGRELGCWIIVEHEAFARVQARATLDHGARILLAHGGAGHVSPGSPRGARRRQVVEFDCVLQVTKTLT